MNAQEKLREILKVAYIRYLIMFKEDVSSSDPYSPIVFSDQDGIGEFYNQGAHLFDPSIEGVLSAIRYVLHLPRIGYDAVGVSPDFILSCHDCPHDILLFPSSEAKFISLIPQIGNSLLIYEDGCEMEARHFLNKNFIDVIPVSGLSSELLSEHWAKVAQIMRVINEEECLPAKLKLLSDECSGPICQDQATAELSKMVSVCSGPSSGPCSK